MSPLAVRQSSAKDNDDDGLFSSWPICNHKEFMHIISTCMSIKSIMSDDNRLVYMHKWLYFCKVTSTYIFQCK